MKIANNSQKCTKKTLMSIAIIVLLAYPITLATLHNASAQTSVTTTPTLAEIFVTPNPVQVNQSVTCNVWIFPYPPSSTTTVHGFSVAITEPNGKQTTIGPLNAYLSSSQYFTYTPDQIGNYTFDFTYPGETYFNNSLVYLPSNASTTLTVQSGPIPTWPDSAPAPNAYWSTPVSGDNRQYYSLTFPFLAQTGYLNYFNYWSEDVLSPHIMWTTPVDLGGTIGGPFGATNYYEGSAYEAKGGSPVIIDGMLIETSERIGENLIGPTMAFDLRTGELKWEYNYTINFAWIMQVDSGNEHALIPYLVSTGSTYKFYNPIDGLELFEIANASTGTNYWTYNANSPMFPTTDDGTWPGTWFIWTYSSSASGVTISLWNSTQCFQNNGWITWQTTPHATDLSQWAPPSSPTTTNSGNWSNGIMWKNVSNQSQYEYLRTTIPNSGNITAQPKSYLSGSKFDFQSGTIVGCGSTGGQAFAAYDALNGNLLWTKNTTDANTVPQAYYSAAGSGKLVFWNLVGDDWVVYNDRTGQELYRTDVTPGGPWNSYVTNPWIQDGTLYDYGYGGGVMSWNLTTGKVNWVCQTSTFNGGNVLGGGNPLRNAPVSSANVLYTANQIKTDFQPIWQNQGTYAINLTSGEQLWKLDIGPSGESSGGSGTHIGVAEGYLVTFGGFTNSWYVIGRGPSKTTLDSTPGVTQGSPLVISGTVMDTSPAQPNTPCVSDASMEQWMEYLHLQKSEPTNTTGVPVTLTEFDSNNNQYTIGTTTSDASGTYAYTWTPTIAGNYTIVATFAGSNSYGPSSAETHIYATAAHASTATSTPTPNSVADTYFVPAIAGLFVLIIIVLAAVVLLIFRKRP